MKPNEKKAKEQFYPLIGYKGEYEISKSGIIKSVKFTKQITMKQAKDKNGYKYIHLQKNGEGRKYKVHGLVLSNFVENIKGHNQINHIDGNKENNNVENLEWCNQFRNMQHARDNGMLSVCKINMSQANKIREEYLKGNVYMTDLGNKYGISSKEISYILSNKRWKTAITKYQNITLSIEEYHQKCELIRDDFYLDRFTGADLSKKYDTTTATISRILNNKVGVNSMTKEKNKARMIFSRYIRIRDCVKTTGSTDYGKCFTCGEIVYHTHSQCGHFISGRGNSLFFEETNAHIQCQKCNISLGGNPEVYRMKMIKKYGLEEVERLESLRHVPVKIRESDFKDLFIEFRSKFNDLNS